MPPFLSDPILLAFLCYCLLVVHRAGHLLGELLVRPRESRHVWPRPVNGGGFWHLLLLPGLGTCAYFGAEPDDAARMRRHDLIENAAGPLANLLLGALLVAAATRAGVWGGPLVIGGLCSLLLGFLYGYPRNAGPCWSDGRTVWDLLRSPACAHRRWALHRVGLAFLNGVRPRDWDADLIADALAANDGSYLDVEAGSIAVMRAIDAGDGAEAAALIARIMNTPMKLQRSLRISIELQAAYVYGYMRGDAEQAARLLGMAFAPDRKTRVTLPLIRKQAPLLVARAEAAVLYAQGEYLGAAGAATQALALTLDPRSEVAGRHAAIERDWLERLARAAEERAGIDSSAGSAAAEARALLSGLS